MSDADTAKFAGLLTELAGILPKASPTELESRLQAFDQLLEYKSPELRELTSTLLAQAAIKAPASTKGRILAASVEIAGGGRCARAYDHAASMKKYEAEFADRMKPRLALPQAAPKPAPLIEPQPERQVTWEVFAAAMNESNATVDPSFRSTGVGHHRCYRSPDGRFCGLIVVRYWHGEEEFDYYIA